LRKELARHNFTSPVYAAPAGPAAAATAAPAGQPVLRPGDNYGTSITTGDVTLWASGPSR
jgi:hypothetical protein